MADSKIYLPRQHTNRGIAGYRGKNVVVVDPETRRGETAPAKAPVRRPARIIGKAGLKPPA